MNLVNKNSRNWKDVISVRRSGLVYIAVSVVLGITAVNSMNNLLYLTTAVLLGCLLSSGVAGRRNIRGASVSLTFPSEVYALVPCPVFVMAHNKNRFTPLFLIDVSLYGKRVFFAFIPPGRTESKTIFITFPSAGEYEIDDDDLRLSSVYPFNFFKRGWPTDCAENVTVLPCPARGGRESVLPDISDGGRSGGGAGETDVVGVRPYAEGDSMKRIHWKSSARTGTLKTRIYEGTARRDRQVSAPYRPPDASADARLSGPGFSLKNLLNILSVVCALLAFFMGKEVIGRPYLFAFPVIIAIAVFIDWKDLPHPPRLFINLASVAALLTIFSHIRFNYIIEALLEAVLLMTAIKMLEKKEPRDYVQISALSLAAIVAYAMLSVEKTFILYCFGTTFFCIVSLTLSAWFLREPDARLAMRELRHVFLRAASLFLLTLPLSLLLFFVMPRMDRPIFGSARGQYGSRTDAVGFSDQVRLGDATSIQANNKLAFRALTEQLPNNVIPYWRGLVLDAFEGRVWLAGRGRQDGGEFVLEPGAPVIEQEIFLEPGNRGVLFTLDQPLSVSGIDAVGLGDGVFRAQPRFTGRRMQYSAVSVLSSQMRPQSPNFDKGRNLLLPPLFIPRLREAAADIARGKNAREKAEAIKAYLAPPAFTYSLDGLPDDPRNALEQFIFTTKRGNCEYFASAMGVMLRAAGVPSRLVSGYAGGTYSDVGGYYIVQEDNAHVWVEAWDEDARAWIRYDPTPIEIGAGAADGFDAWGFYLDMIDYQWSRFIVGYNWEAQSEMLRGLRDAIQNPRAAGLTPTAEGLRRFSSALSDSAAALTGVALCVVGFYLLRTVRRPEIALLRRFLTAMKRHGYTRHESEGLEEFLSRVDEPLRVLALPFVRRFEDFYYGGAAINAAARHISREEIKKITKYKN